MCLLTLRIPLSVLLRRHHAVPALRAPVSSRAGVMVRVFSAAGLTRPEPACGTAGRHEKAFPGTAEQVAHARQFLAGILGGCPARDDAILCLSELASNSVLHSRSAQPGGMFSVRVIRGASAVRVEVADQGGPWRGADGDPARGRGLAIVACLASSWGVTGSDAGRTAWCEFIVPDTLRGTPCPPQQQP
jgi:serine/threonine-protein kinase RsbW